MAKRKRLTPLGPSTLAHSQTELESKAPASAALGRVPIAQVAGDASIAAAFESVRNEFQNAQREGRMILSLALDSVKADYLIRDRLVCDEDEMEALKQSIRHRGQQTPIEVTDLGQGTYGLISGWRRLQALCALHDESGGHERYSKVQALLRLPADRPAAYISMLEENEVRANLSFYERARIALLAVEAGVFESEKKALQTLFSTASFAKRSKVKSFMPVVRALDSVLRFPAQIPERLGLALSRAITEDPGFADDLCQKLKSQSLSTPEAERALLEQFQSGVPSPKAEGTSIKPANDASLDGAIDTDPQAGDVSMSYKKGRIVLEGASVNASFKNDLEAWLHARMQH